jgi:hypothetical protein
MDVTVERVRVGYRNETIEVDLTKKQEQAHGERSNRTGTTDAVAGSVREQVGRAHGRAGR